MRSHSVEPPLFPPDWVVDRAALRDALKTFVADTQVIRDADTSPPSTGNTPPFIELPSTGNTPSSPEAPFTRNTPPNTDSSTRYSTVATSADEANLP